MSPRTILVVVLALACGLCAAAGIQLMRSGEPGGKVETFPVLYAAADIQRGETIKKASLSVRRVPKEQVPEGCLTKEADAVERVAHFPMLKGDVLSDLKLAPKGSGSGMAALIRPGMRAFTIQTASLSSSMAGFLLPGNKVDVLLTVASQGAADDPSGGGSATTILQNIEILAVHTSVDAPSANKMDPDQARSVTLLVTPKQAARLDLGQNKGTLHLTMRNPLDEGMVDEPPATSTDLPLHRPAPPPPVEVAAAPIPAPPPPPPPEPVHRDWVMTTRTLRGTSVGQDRVTVRTPLTPRRSRTQVASDSP
ncbi:Flp pilus assembly protein CpaB [Isosphaeraceae bacterium EP7]